MHTYIHGVHDTYIPYTYLEADRSSTSGHHHRVSTRVDDGRGKKVRSMNREEKKKSGEFGVSVNDPTHQEFMRKIGSHVLWILGQILLEFV